MSGITDWERGEVAVVATIYFFAAFEWARGNPGGELIFAAGTAVLLLFVFKKWRQSSEE